MSSPIAPDSLRPGDHACVTCEPSGVDGLVAAFMTAGFEQQEKLVVLSQSRPRGLWQTLEEGAGADARAAVSLVDPRSPGRDPGSVVDLLRTEKDQALDQGFSSLRVVSLDWGCEAELERKIAFEHLAAGLFTDNRMSALCVYDATPGPAARALAAHPLWVETEPCAQGTALSIEASPTPPQLKVSGELDITNSAEFAAALTALLDVEEEISIDLSELSFIDASCVRHILRLAERRPRRSISLLAPRRGVEWALKLAVPDLPTNLYLEAA